MEKKLLKNFATKEICKSTEIEPKPTPILVPLLRLPNRLESDKKRNKPGQEKKRDQPRKKKTFKTGQTKRGFGHKIGDAFRQQN